MAPLPSWTTIKANVLLLLLALPHAAAIINRNQGGEDFQTFNPVFVAPKLTPSQFLIVSSTRQRKIVYTALRNLKSATGRTFPLVDSGLSRPTSLAVDRRRGALYVADEGASKIYRYQLGVLDENELVTDGARVTVVEGVPVTWITVDDKGDLFYSDPGSGVIARIPFATIMSLADGLYHASALNFLSRGDVQEKHEELLNGTRTSRTDPPAVSNTAFKLYEGTASSHVVSPGGVATDGYNLYWTNTEKGTTAGCVVRGSPAVAGHNTFPPMALSKATDNGLGLVKSTNMLVFSSSNNGVGRVYGMLEKQDQAHVFSSALAEPRGLVWDGDQTVYVADEAMNGVWSLPIGRLVDDTPLTKAAVLDGAFGVALFSSSDVGWHVRGSAFHLSGHLGAVLLAWIMAWTSVRGG